MPEPNDYLQELRERTLADILHFSRTGKPYAFITPCLPGMEHDIQCANLKKFENILGSRQLSYWPLDAFWRHQETREVISEPSYMVLNITPALAQKICSKFNLELMLVGDADCVCLTRPDGAWELLGEELTPKSLARVYGPRQGEDYTFEALLQSINNWFDALRRGLHIEYYAHLKVGNSTR